MKRTQKEGLNGVVEKINNKRISLLWTYPNNSKLEVNLYHNQMSEQLRRKKNNKVERTQVEKRNDDYDGNQKLNEQDRL